MTEKTETAIKKIAEISEDLLRTDKAVHDGFMKCVKDNGYLLDDNKTKD